MALPYDKLKAVLSHTDPVRTMGKVVQIVGLVVEAQVEGVSIGELCQISVDAEKPLSAEVREVNEER